MSFPIADVVWVIAMAPLEKADQAAPLKVSEVAHDALESSPDIWRERLARFFFVFYQAPDGVIAFMGVALINDTLQDGEMAK